MSITKQVGDTKITVVASKDRIVSPWLKYSLLVLFAGMSILLFYGSGKQNTAMAIICIFVSTFITFLSAFVLYLLDQFGFLDIDVYSVYKSDRLYATVIKTERAADCKRIRELLQQCENEIRKDTESQLETNEFLNTCIKR